MQCLFLVIKKIYERDERIPCSCVFIVVIISDYGAFYGSLYDISAVSHKQNVGTVSHNLTSKQSWAREGEKSGAPQDICQSRQKINEPVNYGVLNCENP